MNENVIEWLTGDETACVTFSQAKYKNRIKRLKEQNEAIRMIENEDGSIYAEIPLDYASIRKPKQLNLTEEERAEIAARFKQGKIAKEEFDDEDTE